MVAVLLAPSVAPAAALDVNNRQAPIAYGSMSLPAEGYRLAGTTSRSTARNEARCTSTSRPLTRLTSTNRPTARDEPR